MDTSNKNLDLYKRLLKEGKSILRLELGIVSKVVSDKYTLIAIDDVTNDFKPGDTPKLSNTFCREVIADNKTMALTQYEKAQGMRKHLLYAVNALEAHIGAPIILDGNMWGTVNFSSVKLRDAVFSTQDVALVDSYVTSISESLSI